MTIRACEAMNAPVGRLSDRTVCEANGGVLPRQVLIDADGCPVVNLTLQIQFYETEEKRHRLQPIRAGISYQYYGPA